MKISYLEANGYVIGWGAANDVPLGDSANIAEIPDGAALQSFAENFDDYRVVGGELVYNPERGAAALRKQAQLRQESASAISARLEALSQDFIQDLVGEAVPDIKTRKAEFIALHNELRVLQGKPPREVNQ